MNKQKPLRRAVRRGLRALNPFRLLRMLRRGLFSLRNRLRRRAKIGYVVLDLDPEVPALPEPRGFLRRRVLGEAPMSLTDLDRHFRRIAADPRPQGVLLQLRGFAMPLSQLQTLRGSIKRLRESGKRVVVYAKSYDLATYYVASAADEILVQPGGLLLTTGLFQQATFLKDALDQVGVKFDVVAITPYKGAYDGLSRSDISPQGREQLEWLLDSRYDMIVEDIAADRGISPEAVREMIDCSPMVDSEAHERGYFDAVLNEEGLPAHLNVEANLMVAWERADKVLLKPWRKASSRYVALLNLSGMIIDGKSRSAPNLPVPLPFIGGEVMGDETVVQQVRALMRQEAFAAVILYIDSGGGSAAASEAMTSAIAELAKDRPVVAFFDGVAASGGYYIATPARWIVAQPGTITGSIGVLSGKPVGGELLDKLRINRVSFARGENAGMFSTEQPYTEEQRALVRRFIERLYDQFLDRVAEGRNLTREAVDAVGGGRVWTGAQALQNGLVDELGDLQAALKKARTLADLPDDTPLVLFSGGGKSALPPQLAEKADPAAALRAPLSLVGQVLDGRPLLLCPVEIE